MTQVWRPVVGYEGYYEVSNDGFVRSLDRDVLAKGRRTYTRRGKQLAGHIQEGYWRVGLTKPNGKIRNWPVHRLVCEAFHGVRPGVGIVVRHLNGISTDNRAENLAWGTSKDNHDDCLDRPGGVQAGTRIHAREHLPGGWAQGWPSTTLPRVPTHPKRRMQSPCSEAGMSWNDEWRDAVHATTELQRAQPLHTAAGMRLDEREDLGKDDL